jgi:hypothetical protein
MNDNKILEEMFKRNGIAYTEDIDIDDNTKSFTIENGCVGFYSVFTFNEDGSLRSVKAFE